MANKNELISIVMPVYNADKFLVSALNSLYQQTHTNWELIVIDDHSTDASYSILKTAAKNDPRIKLSRNSSNLGVSETANLAIKKTKGLYIARMDADDIASPNRLEKQLSYLQKNPNVIVVGGQCSVINHLDETIGAKLFPQDDSSIKKMIFTRIPIQQPTIMVNTKLLPKNFVWYDKNFTVSEEIELIFRLAKYGLLANLKDIILQYRIHQTNTSLLNPKKTFFDTLKARLQAIRKYHYYPTPLAVVINIIQLAVVLILPNKAIYPVYSFLRGISKLKPVTLNLSSFSLQRITTS